MVKPVEPVYVLARETTTLHNGGGPNKTKPKNINAQVGYDYGKALPVEDFNYILNNLGLWVEYVSDELELEKTRGEELKRVLTEKGLVEDGDFES